MKTSRLERRWSNARPPTRSWLMYRSCHQSRHVLKTQFMGYVSSKLWCLGNGLGGERCSSDKGDDQGEGEKDDKSMYQSSGLSHEMRG